MGMITDRETAQASVEAVLMEAQARLVTIEEMHLRAVASLRRERNELRKITARISGLDPEPSTNVVRFAPREMADVA